MKIWIDAQLSPDIAYWIDAQFDCEATALRDLGLRDATDKEIFTAAGREGAVVLTKDRDFADLVRQFGPPPQIVWLTCGNTSNKRLKEILSLTLQRAINLIQNGEPLIEIQSP